VSKLPFKIASGDAEERAVNSEGPGKDLGGTGERKGDNRDGHLALMLSGGGSLYFPKSISRVGGGGGPIQEGCLRCMTFFRPGGTVGRWGGVRDEGQRLGSALKERSEKEKKKK